MLMSLGEFVFELGTLAPTNVQRELTVNWEKQNPYGGQPALQFTGIAGETLSMSGVLYPASKITGTAKDLQTIETMAKSGEDFVLAGGDGYVRGMFAILSLSETHTHLTPSGQARKIEFEISLERTDDDRTVRLPDDA